MIEDTVFIIIFDKKYISYDIMRHRVKFVIRSYSKGGGSDAENEKNCKENHCKDGKRFRQRRSQYSMSFFKLSTEGANGCKKAS